MTERYAKELSERLTLKDLTENDIYIMEVFDIDLKKYREVKSKCVTWEKLYLPSLYIYKDLLRRYVREKLQTESMFEVSRNLGRSTKFIKQLLEE